MNSTVTVTLPEKVLKQAESLAHRTGRSIGEVLAETIELTLRPLGTEPEGPETGSWSDAEVLSAASATLSDRDDRRLSHLLDQQQSGELSAPGRTELMGLMETYRSVCCTRLWHSVKPCVADFQGTSAHESPIDPGCSSRPCPNRRWHEVRLLFKSPTFDPWPTGN